MTLLLQNATAIFLQNATYECITKCSRFLTSKCKSYYEMWHLLENASVRHVLFDVSSKNDLNWKKGEINNSVEFAQ